MGRKKAEKAGTKIWYIALYLRLSKEDKAKLAGAVNSDSIANQDKILADFINQLRAASPDDVFEVAGVYIDDGITGTNTDKREQFNIMVDDILRGKINCVLFKDLSRMFRNHTEQSQFLEYFCPTNNIRVISINNRLDTYVDPEAVYSYDVTLTGVSNDRYCYTISKNIIRTFEMKRARGEYIGAFAPYGYLKDKENKNKLIIDENAAPIVRDIFNWYANGDKSIGQIVRQLNEMGVLSPTDYKRSIGLKYNNPHKRFENCLWSERTLRKILSNQMYIGNMVQGKTAKVSYKIDKFRQIDEEDWVVVEGTHEPIIEKKLFDRVQELRLLNVKSVSKSLESKSINLFAGILKCGECGRTMSRKQNKNVNHALYRCQVNRYASGTCASRGSMREPALIDVVLKVIQSQVMFIEDITEIIEIIENVPFQSRENNRLNLQYKKVTEELKVVEEKRDRLYEDLNSNLITKEQYVRFLEKYSTEAENKKIIFKSLKKQMNELKNGDDNENLYFHMIKKHKNIETLDRSIIVELIGEIRISKEKAVEIDFKFSDQIQRVSGLH